ncbi:hypothetical protein Taro_043653 [Colocasia esculenta]|uniref:CTP synthase N-terminal domain-containing protein n=1 Tax=Colocasia esculenta TaxID=4460 RepID=A0A843WWB8_COLES|nr:hypothetical protein [Colocasia esculenta]
MGKWELVGQNAHLGHVWRAGTPTRGACLAPRGPAGQPTSAQGLLVKTSSQGPHAAGTRGTRPFLPLSSLLLSPPNCAYINPHFVKFSLRHRRMGARHHRGLEFKVDLDLGNYERFLDVRLTRDNNITTGKIYQSVIDKERKGDYLGKTVQVVPHITDAIKNWIETVSSVSVDGKDGPPDICVIELGGTVGDIESMPFIEALRQLSFSVGD